MDWPIALFDTLRIVQIALATIFLGMFTKLAVLRLRDRPVTTTHPLVVVGILLLLLTTPFEHLLRIGMEPSWRMPVHIVGYVLGIVGVVKTKTMKFKTKAMKFKRPDWKRRRGN